MFVKPWSFQVSRQNMATFAHCRTTYTKEGIISFPIYNKEGKIEVVSFSKDSPDLNASDPRVISYKGKDYLTTMSYLRLVSSTDGIHFKDEPEFPPIFGKGELETFGIEDCRVATTEDGFYLTFTEVSPVAVGVGLIHTKDWKNYVRYGNDISAT